MPSSAIFHALWARFCFEHGSTSTFLASMIRRDGRQAQVTTWHQVVYLPFSLVVQKLLGPFTSECMSKHVCDSKLTLGSVGKSGGQRETNIQRSHPRKGRAQAKGTFLESPRNPTPPPFPHQINKAKKQNTIQKSGCCPKFPARCFFLGPKYFADPEPGRPRRAQPPGFPRTRHVRRPDVARLRLPADHVPRQAQRLVRDVALAEGLGGRGGGGELRGIGVELGSPKRGVHQKGMPGASMTLREWGHWPKYKGGRTPFLKGQGDSRYARTCANGQRSELSPTCSEVYAGKPPCCPGAVSAAFISTTPSASASSAAACATGKVEPSLA